MKEKVAMDELSQRIRNYLFENFMYGYDENEFSNNTSFLDAGILDSTGIVELIVFIESEFNIEVSDMEILPENLDSVNCVSRFVYDKIKFSEQVNEGL